MDGTALIYCEGAFGRPEGKTANGLVRFGRRYEILGVIDSEHSGRLAGDIISGVAKAIPVFSSLHQGIEALRRRPDYLVIGFNPPDGRMPPQHRKVIRDALKNGISVDSALKPYIVDDAEFPGLTMQSSAKIRAVGYPKPLAQLRSYTGEIQEVGSARVAVVGTHSVVGKRTTTVRLTEALQADGISTVMIGTGETSWFQGIRWTVILDAIVHKYVAGELEGVIVDAWRSVRPDVMVLEGQGSVLNPSNPSGLELLTTARPSAIVMQHAPTHSSLEADDRFGMRTLERHIRTAELLSGAPVVAITLSPEGNSPEFFGEATTALRSQFGLLVTDVIADGTQALTGVVRDSIQLSIDAAS
ncbi:MAG: DUF1611 domain-containing protein [Blastocatellia bacterium]